MRKVKNMVRAAMLTVVLLVAQLATAQHVALKTNLLYDACMVPSLGAELAMSNHCSLGVMGTYNPWGSGDRKWLNYSVQPELRLWPHRAFTGPYFGINAVGGGYNVNGIHLFGLKSNHRQGYFYGGGISVGWHYILSTRLSLETQISASFVHANYDLVENRRRADSGYTNTVVPIGTGINLVYIIN
jgi:hypothetical protein